MRRARDGCHENASYTRKGFWLEWKLRRLAGKQEGLMKKFTCGKREGRMLDCSPTITEIECDCF